VIDYHSCSVVSFHRTIVAKRPHDLPPSSIVSKQELIAENKPPLIPASDFRVSARHKLLPAATILTMLSWEAEQADQKIKLSHETGKQTGVTVL
jgi:hypothetical protein